MSQILIFVLRLSPFYCKLLPLDIDDWKVSVVTKLNGQNKLLKLLDIWCNSWCA